MIPLGIFNSFWSTGSIGLQIVFLLLFLAYVTYLGASRLNMKVLRTCAIVILVCGIGLYGYGYTVSNELEGPFTIFLRSLLSSVEMFVSRHSLLEIEKAQQRPYFLDIFVFVYSCAVVTSISAIISLFGKRAMTNITLKLYKRRHISFRHIFFGIDHNSADLARHLKDTGKKERIAFIEFPSDEEVAELSFGSIIQNVFRGIVDRSGLNQDKVVILKARRNISDITPGNKVLRQMGLERLKGLVDSNTSFYLLSDDTDKNIQNVLALVTDNFFKSHTIQCHAYKTGLTEQYEKSLFYTHVHFFYPDSMAIQTLRENGNYHPVTTMNIASDSKGRSLGYVTDDSFDALIFGFGESGQEAFKFLFKYGSFIGADGNPLPERCYLQDPDMDSLSGSFRAAMPGLPTDREIIYEKVDYLSEEFWEKLMDRLDSLNYIIFSCNDDQKNLNAATRVFDYAYSARKGGVANLKILVRVVEGNANINAICDFYNSKAGTQCILQYGDRREMFSPKWTVSGNSIGVSSHSVGYAKSMYKSYWKGLEMEGPSWHERNKVCEKAKSENDFETLLQQIRFLRQYIDSAYYSYTPSQLGKGFEELFKSIPVDVNDFMKLPEDERKIIDTLSNTIHLCWCRHLVLDGYVYAEKNVETEKKNQYLHSWDEMSDKDRHQFRLNVKGIFLYLDEK